MMMMLIRFALLLVGLQQAAAESSPPSPAPQVRGAVQTASPPIFEDKSKKGAKGYKKGIAYQQDFNMLCQVILTKESIAHELTQQEYADFVFDYCDHVPNRGALCIKKTSFTELPMPVQELFVSMGCPLDEFVDSEECLQRKEADPTAHSFEGGVPKLCHETYDAMQETGMLVDPSSMPSSIYFVTGPPSLRPASDRPTSPVVSPTTMTSQPATPLPETVPSDSTPQPSDTGEPNDVPNISEETQQPEPPEPPEPEMDPSPSSDGESMSSKGIAFTVAAVAAALLTKTLIVGAYIELRKQKRANTVDFDPYLQEHSALGSECSFSLTFDDGGETGMEQRHRLLKPCEQILVLDPLAPLSSRDDESALFEQRRLSLATSIFDERLLPHVDGYKAACGTDLMSPQASSDETNSQDSSGTKSDPISIMVEPAEPAQPAHWQESREKWRLSRDESFDITILEDIPASARRKKRRGPNSTEECSVSSSRSSHSSSSVSISIKQSFQLFDESISGGIETLRSDLSEYDGVEAASSHDTADDSISVHINRSAKVNGAK